MKLTKTKLRQIIKEEVKNLREAKKVKSASDFENRLRGGTWQYDRKELSILQKFVKEMDKKYGKDEHKWGRQSQFAFKHPTFYSYL